MRLLKSDREKIKEEAKKLNKNIKVKFYERESINQVGVKGSHYRINTDQYINEVFINDIIRTINARYREGEMSFLFFS